MLLDDDLEQSINSVNIATLETSHLKIKFI